MCVLGGEVASAILFSSRTGGSTNRESKEQMDRDDQIALVLTCPERIQQIARNLRERHACDHLWS